jgi:hypothetical protein
VHRYGVIALAVLAAELLIAVSASTDRLIPLAPGAGRRAPP